MRHLRSQEQCVGLSAFFLCVGGGGGDTGQKSEPDEPNGPLNP